MIQINECLSLIASFPSLGRTETVDLGNSLGRVLAQDVIADMDQPPFHKSAMDGFACRKSDLPGPLSVVGQIAAGNFTENMLEKGNCYQIFTGAPVPEGADCVIMQEYIEKDALGNIHLTEPDTKSNICYQGEDLKAGDVAIKAGTVINPQDIAVMAGFGVVKPLVTCTPRVAVICTGSELVEPSVRPDRAQIRNSNACQLVAQLSLFCKEIAYLGILSDHLDMLKQRISEMIDSYDVIIVTGGASVGEYDLMPVALRELGASVHFTALNIQPGKPALFSTIRNTYILGLSGNPVSSFLQFSLVVKPLLFRLSGCISAPIKIVRVPLAGPIKRKKGNRQLYVPVSFLPSGFAKPVPFHGSAHIAALCGFDGFAIVEPDVQEMKENQLINILLA